MKREPVLYRHRKFWIGFAVLVGSFAVIYSGWELFSAMSLIIIYGIYVDVKEVLDKIARRV